MASPYIIISRFPITLGKANGALKKLPKDRDACHYVDTGGEEIMEIRAISHLREIERIEVLLGGQMAALEDCLAGDVRRELLRFVEAPKPGRSPLPKTPHLQLRHIEVPPSVMQGYRAWRERTIFDVIRAAPEVETFSAYHSLISSQPGVMFLSGFSGHPDAYSAVFTSSIYKDIVREAGENYIVGGPDSLYTKLYHNSAIHLA